MRRIGERAVVLGAGVGRSILTVFGYEGHHPSRDPDRFLDFVATVAPPGVRAGLSVSALQAASLAGTLADGDRDLEPRFFRAAARPVTMAWQAVVGADLALPQVQARRPLPVRVVGGYVARALRAAERDPVVAQQFLRVAALQDPSSRLLRPAIALRVQRASLRRGAASTADGAAPGVPVP